MKNIKKMMSRFVILSLLAGAVGFASAFSASRQFDKVKADGEETTVTTGYTASDFEDEEAVNPDSLTADITQSTTTDTSQSLTITFRSVTGTAFKSSAGNYLVEIDDENYTGDISSPAPEGYSRIDEESGLPIFHGVVYRVVGGANKNSQSVFIPSTLTRDERLIIQIDTILGDCVVPSPAEGEEEIKNSWKNPDQSPRITDIYIPNTITNVADGAFTGVPSEGVTIHYEGTSIPEGFSEHWTDAPESALDIREDSYSVARFKNAGVGGTEDIGVPDNFILGCQRGEAGGKYDSDDYNKPLIIEYTKNKADGSQEVVYEELPLINTVGNNYDGVGVISAKTYTRLLGYKLAEGESIEDNTIVFHNILRFYDPEEGRGNLINPEKQYFAKARITYPEKQKLSNLVTFKAAQNSTFLGYSMFTLTMDKNLSITSEKYPEPHSLYLDVKSDMYEQNILKIKEGKTIIRYSLYNLYNSSYHFQYIGAGGVKKDIVVPISTAISYQTLDHVKGNKVSILLKNSEVWKRLDKAGVPNAEQYKDFAAEKVTLFELKDITIQMDLMTKSDSGSTSVLGKSQISYKFAYLTVVDQEKTINVFNWNIFLLVFLLSYMALYAVGAFIMYRVLKEKFKNDEFRRVNNKKYLKSAILGGLGSLVIVTAILFIIMRVSGFQNTIVSFNPTDPLLIGFSIAGIIIFGYFVVLLVKLIKTEKERRKIIKLKLNEDVEDDGTN